MIKEIDRKRYLKSAVERIKGVVSLEMPSHRWTELTNRQ